MNLRLRDRHLYAAGAAATIATAACAGILFALVVDGAAVLPLVQRKCSG